MGSYYNSPKTIMKEQKENPCFGKQGSLTQTNKHKNYFLRCAKITRILFKRQVIVHKIFVKYVSTTIDGFSYLIDSQHYMQN